MVNELQLLYFACTCIECQIDRQRISDSTRLGFSCVVFKLKLSSNSVSIYNMQWYCNSKSIVQNSMNILENVFGVLCFMCAFLV